MVKGSKVTAEMAYENAHIAASELLNRLTALLQDMPAPGGDEAIHWGHVGNVNHVNELLRTAADFLGGKSN